MVISISWHRKRWQTLSLADFFIDVVLSFLLDCPGLEHFISISLPITDVSQLSLAICFYFFYLLLSSSSSTTRSCQARCCLLSSKPQRFALRGRASQLPGPPRGHFCPRRGPVSAARPSPAPPQAPPRARQLPGGGAGRSERGAG